MGKGKLLTIVLYIKSYIDTILPTKADKSDVEKQMDKVRLSIGANDKLQIQFSGTNNLDDCKSIVEAIIKLDSLISKKQQ